MAELRTAAAPANWTIAATVIAVIVTMDRPESLGRALEAIAAQTAPPSGIIVVDNAPGEATEKVVRSSRVPATYLPARRNLGGAGGFALGMLHALAAGADFVWLGDDDGCPSDPSHLARLIGCLQDRGLAMVSPVVVDIADPSRLAFPLRRGLRWRARRDELGSEFLPGYASLFNGALFTAAAIESVGVPDLRMFLRGDEVDVHRRLSRSGLPFGTCLTATYLHPYGGDEFKPILGGFLSAQEPAHGFKRFYTYRNRGYLMSQRGMRWLRPLEEIRFGWFFLITKRSATQWLEWRRLTQLGRHERFTRHAEHGLEPRGSGL